MKLALVPLLIVTAGVPAAAHLQGRAEGPLTVVQELFDAMRQRDTAAMRALMDPRVRLVTTGHRGGEPTIRVAALDDWLRAVAAASVDLDERTWDPRVEVDHELATVWVKYEFVAGGVFSHCGVDAFQLFKGPLGWRVFQIADTQRREPCWHRDP